MKEPREGDIYRWSWNQEELKKRKSQIESGTLYWCCSGILVFREDGRFWDTYWGFSYDNSKRFTPEELIEKMEIEYLGNFDALENVAEYNRAYYDDKDCVDLNHPNWSQGNFYIRKGAKKSLSKMKTIISRNIEKLESDIAYARSLMESIKKEMDGISEDSRITIIHEVNLND